ncbi:sensor histidine kinase YesM [Paenibacillus albilobatus]|uniref:Sensor histidine kinase YesM n=1 Tax=Paenibacillus albilobatus TaxID=2716884 RepID=A0A919XIH2_9BACL|nr:histidine kinase [Paenibacillus albilobatus]GIO33512.1 sensor histidine kinase YesM [Paenibacillus albilobatus]
MKFIHRLSSKSIRFKLIAGFLLFVIPLQLLLIFDNYYAMKVVREQVANSNRHLAALYMDQIDRNLEEIDKYLRTMVAFENDLIVLDRPADVNMDEYFLAKINLFNKLERDIHTYKEMDYLFVYSSVNEELITNQPPEATMAELKMIRQGMIQMLEERNGLQKQAFEKWFPYNLNEEYYIVKIQKIGNVYVGGWVKASKLMIPLSLLDVRPEGKSVLVTETLKPMSGNAPIDNNDDYLQVSTHSKQGKFSLLFLIPYSVILEHLPLLQRLWYLLILGAFIILPIFYIFLRHIILLPINRIVKVMRRVRDGNLEQRVEPYPVSYEFELMNDVFNSMVSEIKALKITVYEEQLLIQKAELKHLQLQINPHFFLNALNTIYNLAQFQNYQLIRDMSEHLINYMRFMFQNNLKFVTLEEEIAHTRNYLQIQALRFEDAFTYRINVDESLSQALIPPLMIQTFAENTIKHAVTMDEPIRLNVDIQLRGDQEPYLCIVIQDTGKGFSEQALSEWQSEDESAHGDSGHIGIWNSRRRLRLIYQDRAKLILSNHPNGGARVEVWLPFMLGDPSEVGKHVSIADR